MARGDAIAKKLYMREHSNLIRKKSAIKGHESSVEEDPVVEITGLAKTIMTILCRNKQRIKQQAWHRWIKNANVKHDYTKDLRLILSREIPPDEFRTELEIEVLWKWAHQNAEIDPTGIANALSRCKKKTVIVSVLQQCRLERIFVGDPIICQGSMPRMEDGHFTIISGELEVLQYPDNSMQILKLNELLHSKNWDGVHQILRQAQSLGKLGFPAGFGEIATLTNTKRTATIICSRRSRDPAEVLVVPKQAILDCLESRRKSDDDNGNTSEAIDFLRQSGLAQNISAKDLMQAAESMTKRTLLRGEILFCKGENVTSLFLVVSGDVVLDCGNSISDEGFEPFRNPNHSHCYHLSSGSILGDEGVTGKHHIFESTCAVVSDIAVVFEATGFAMNFLVDRLGALRYCALTYRNRPRWSIPIKSAESMNIYTTLNSLRKCIALLHPYRALKTGKALAMTFDSDTNASEEGDSELNEGIHDVNRPNTSDSTKSGLGMSRREESIMGMKCVVDISTRQVRRMISGVHLHHAEEALRISRKRSDQLSKSSAQVRNNDITIYLRENNDHL